MKSVTKSIRLPPPLIAALEAEALEFGYRDFSDYVRVVLTNRAVSPRVCELEKIAQALDRIERHLGVDRPDRWDEIAEAYRTAK